MKESVWRSGPSPERSFKSERPAPTKTQSANDHKHSSEHGKQAVMTALEMGDPLQGFRACSSKREDANAKIGERQLIGRVSHNPFLSEDTYLADITVEDSLLRPRNTKD